MRTTNGDLFLIKITQKIKNGDYDDYFTIPFQTKELFLTTIKHKISKRVEKGGLPVLTDTEINECITESWDIAYDLLNTYIGLGFLALTDNGIELTESGHLAIKNTNIN
jgi:hypothetical protein